MADGEQLKLQIELTGDTSSELQGPSRTPGPDYPQMGQYRLSSGRFAPRPDAGPDPYHKPWVPLSAPQQITNAPPSQFTQRELFPPPPAPASSIPAAPQSSQPAISDFEKRYGKNFKTAQDVLQFINQHGREPTSADMPAGRPGPGGSGVLRITPPMPQSPQGPDNPQGFTFDTENPWKIHSDPGFKVPPGINIPGAEGSGKGGGGGRGGKRKTTFDFPEDDEPNYSFTNPHNKTPPTKGEKYWEEFKAALFGPATKYGISSAAYVIGGAVGRITGSPALGVIAGGAARTGLLAGVGSGVLTGGSLIALQGVSIAATALTTIFDKLKDTANDLSQDFAKVSGPLAATYGSINASNISKDIELASRGKDTLIPFLNSQNQVYQELRELKVNILNQLLPAVTGILTTLGLILDALNTGWNFMFGDGVSSWMSLIWNSIPGFPGFGYAFELLKFIAWVFGYGGNQGSDKAIDEFLNSNTWNPTKPNAPYFPLGMPPTRRGVF